MIRLFTMANVSLTIGTEFQALKRIVRRAGASCFVVGRLYSVSDRSVQDLRMVHADDNQIEYDGWSAQYGRITDGYRGTYVEMMYM